MAAPRDGLYDQPLSNGPSHVYDRLNSRVAPLRMASPRIGGSRAGLDEDYSSNRRTYSPPSYIRGGGPGLDRSFKISESSPAERRRLIADLRSEVRRTATARGSPLKNSIPYYHNGGDFGSGKRSFDTSFEERRSTGQYNFDEGVSMNRGKRSTEEDAERELAELERSTENLKRLGSDMLSATSAFIGQAASKRGISQRATQLPRPAETTSPTFSAYPAPQMPTAHLASQQPVAYIPAPYPVPGQTSSPYSFAPSPSSPQQGHQVVYASPPPGYPAYYVMPAIPGYPPVVYPMVPPGYPPSTPATAPSQPAPQAPGTDSKASYTFQQPAVVPIVSESKVTTSSEPTQRVSLDMRSEETKVPETPESKEIPIAIEQQARSQADASAASAIETQASQSVAELVSNAPVVIVPKPVEQPKADSSLSPAEYEPSGQTAKSVPPAHVNIHDIEDERERRKREFLARRQNNAAEKSSAELAGAAAGIASSKQESKEALDAQAATAPASAAPRRPVIISNEESEADLLQARGEGLTRASSAPDVSTTREPNDDEEAERAHRLQRQAEEAARLKPIDNSMALVPFGSFLREMAANGGSYDDADLASGSFGRVRPPPIFGKGGSTTGRRRALSSDAADGKSVAPPSEIIKPAERTPKMMQGYLMKTSGPKRPTQLRGTWQKRYFILSGRLLLYTAFQGSTQVKRMMDLNRIDVVTDKLPELASAPTPHCIGLVEKGEPRMLTICAQTHEEILEWYKAIINNCALLCENKILTNSKPPVNKTKSDPRLKWRQDVEARYMAQLPMPPAPEPSWFYPDWQKPKSYYDLLGLPNDATSGMIKKSYYKIAKDSHPDRSTRSFKGLQEQKSSINPEEFAEVALAYETLIDPEKRTAYDLAEKVKEDLRRGIDCYRLECIWSDDDLQYEPRVRIIRKVIRKRITIFCDGEIKCLYWQPASEPNEDGFAPLLPLRPNAKRSIEMRFVQQVLYFRDGPIDFGNNEPPPYEGENRFLILGDRLHTGPLLFQMDCAQACTELVHGLRVARCEKSMLFQQKLDALRKQGIQ